MKKKLVSIAPEQNVFVADTASEEFYYGIKNNHTHMKGFVQRRNYGHGHYSAMAADAVTKGNDWDQYDNISIQVILKNLAKNDFFTIYQFDAFQELFAWLSVKE